MDTMKQLKEKYRAVLPFLDEKQQRLLIAAGAEALGRGGISLVAQASGISRPTIYQGLSDLKNPKKKTDRVRRKGGGRKRKCETDPQLAKELESILEPDTRGDPQSPLRWTCKSTRRIAEVLTNRGHKISHNAVADLLHVLDYSLQGNRKTLEGKSHPDRDAQFRYINRQVKRYLSAKNPVISVDTKKKELVGNFKNGGQEWHKKGHPAEVNIYDFPDPNMPRAIPYGIYDLFHNKGWVNVGISHDTAEFAVASIRRWWQYMGRLCYKNPQKILICADSGGSNGYRIKLWKMELQKWANEIGTAITICHYPPGTSKWNKIEHCLFSYITMNWRGKPLTSYEVVVKLIGQTRTKHGLKVQAKLDKRKYPAKRKVTTEQMEEINLHPHKFHGEWNYTIRAE